MLGRPKKISIDEQFINQVKEMAARGLQHKDIAAVMGISEQTWWEYRRENPELEDAFRSGKAEGLNRSGAALLRKVDAGVIDAIKWYENTRHGMSERVTHGIDLDIMDREALEEAFIQLMSGILPGLANTASASHDDESAT